MFWSYTKIALRNLLKHKAYSFINLLGLATGLACSILITGYLYNELSYDKYHKNADRIYRVTSDLSAAGSERKMATTSAPLAAELRKDLPEIERTVRFYPGSRTSVKYAGQEFFEEKYLYADASVFDAFSFPLVKGNPETALAQPLAVVITEETAKKYFGDHDPIGKTLNFNNEADFTVTGIIEEVPDNSHFSFNMLCSFETLYLGNGDYMARRGNFRYYTYVLLRKHVAPQELERKFPAFVKTFFNLTDEQAHDFRFVLQPLTSIHLRSNLEREITGNSDITYIYTFASVAIFILLIAVINFTNLATARSAKRALEIGVRKLMGAEKGKLVQQFLGESLSYSVIACLIALVLVELVLPYFSALSGSKLSLDYLGVPWLSAGFVGLTLVVGILAGSYPAFFLAAFRPIQAMKGSLKAGAARARFRRILVVTQFAISTTLIISSRIVFDQLNYMKSTKLGFDKEQVVVIPIDNRVTGSLDAIKDEFKKQAGVVSVAASSHVPGLFYNTYSYLPEGSEEDMQMKLINVDQDFIPTLGMAMAAGRNFSGKFPSDHEGSVIINETAARIIGWDNPVGKRIRHNYGQGEVTRTVIGVVKDFHFTSLHEAIEPLYISNETGWLRSLSVRISPENMQQTAGFLKEKWRELVPNRSFDYFFLDESFDGQYQADERLSALFTHFTVFAVFIAGLGLFGMVSFTAEQRTKEIGIRKVVGASVPKIVTMLSKEVVTLIATANLIAWPLAYYAMRKWLQAFAYQTSIDILSFVMSAASVFAIAFMTIFYQSIKAALANPVDALRYE